MPKLRKAIKRLAKDLFLHRNKKRPASKPLGRKPPGHGKKLAWRLRQPGRGHAIALEDSAYWGRPAIAVNGTKELSLRQPTLEERCRVSSPTMQPLIESRPVSQWQLMAAVGSGSNLLSVGKSCGVDERFLSGK